MTTPVSFTKCIKAIKKHAFQTSGYPVIITIENHCNVKNRRIMAQVRERKSNNNIEIFILVFVAAAFPNPHMAVFLFVFMDRY